MFFRLTAKRMMKKPLDKSHTPRRVKTKALSLPGGINIYELCGRHFSTQRIPASKPLSLKPGIYIRGRQKIAVTQ